MASTRIEIKDLDEQLIAEVTRPRKVLIRAPFGAMKARCFVELHQRDRNLPVDHACECKVIVDETVKFRGTVVEVRRDTQWDELSFYAVREPGLTMTEGVDGNYEESSAAEVLEDIVGSLSASPLSLLSTPETGAPIDRLEFVKYDLFYAIDLLAKLAGNFLWDIDWSDRLRFRPHEFPADHTLRYDPRWHGIKIWKTSEPIENVFDFYGGVAEGNQLARMFAEADSVERYGARRKSLFTPPIVTQQAYEYLKSAVLEQLPWPVYRKYIDLYEEDVDIRFGDTLQILNTGMIGFEEEQLYRVKMEEVVVPSDGRVQSRYYLAELWESSSRYSRYIDHIKGEPATDYASRRLGSFRLDHSALDSQAHLD